MSEIFVQLSLLLVALCLFSGAFWLLFRGSIIFKLSLLWISNLYITISNTVISVNSEGAYSFFIAMVVNSVVTIFFLALFTLVIKRPLRDLVETMNTFSRGDFSKRTVDLESNKGNEIGELNRGIEDLRKSFATVLQSVSNNAQAIQQACTTLSINSRNLSATVNDNASSLEEISSSMEEMVSNIAANVENTQKTEGIAKKANSSVIVGNKSVNEALSLMTEISEKIQIVNEISFETNVLALNASVEASRAGEHGRGFAVVASEIRRLAEHSKEASNEIKEMTARGAVMSNDATQQLDEILPLMQQTTVNIQEINVASMEQNSGADQINNAVQSMNKVTQQNAVIADEMMQNSDSILQTANTLLSHIKQFKF